MDMNFVDLLDGLAQLPWGPPHHIEAAIEEHVEEHEALLPLDVRLMQQMPPIDGREFGFQIRGQVADPVDNSRPYVDLPEDSLHWPDCEGLDYVGVQDHYEWSLVLPEENMEDEIIVDKEAPLGDSIDGSLSTKRPDPITDDNMLLQGINPSASHIATIGLQETPMMNSTPPTFVPILEPSARR
ncbi:hypothetical protein M758_4G118000 [Ceratodon purpureus]|uniref:Uncharacterized protein n=1 Tax=Ceratodon purpureus TaxID=3225 RepID=A0A8T0I7P2_CERPU|nr:hypothetical protein KC19_4G117800 [Ceratodon purpureus]KAG0619114.1 hypothetical protein M758_4G118000 [Ceratodon purpureus]